MSPTILGPVTFIPSSSRAITFAYHLHRQLHTVTASHILPLTFDLRHQIGGGSSSSAHVMLEKQRFESLEPIWYNHTAAMSLKMSCSPRHVFTCSGLCHPRVYYCVLFTAYLDVFSYRLFMYFIFCVFSASMYFIGLFIASGCFFMCIYCIWMYFIVSLTVSGCIFLCYCIWMYFLMGCLLYLDVFYYGCLLHPDVFYYELFTASRCILF